MSDALCGPSNPLQQFKQQTQLDRTLQQDRLASRYSPSQGFRSPNPHAGALDPEFEAFQAGLPPSDLSSFQQHVPVHPRLRETPQTPSWAADFQQMRVSAPQTAQQQHFPQAIATGPSWAQGFRDETSHTLPRVQTSASSPQQFQYMARHGGWNGFRGDAGPASFSHANGKAIAKQPAIETYDAVAFERAFDQAREDMMMGVEDATSAGPLYTADAVVDDYEAQEIESRREATATFNQRQENLPADAADELSVPFVESLPQLTNLSDNLQQMSMDDQIVQSEEQEQQRQQQEDDALAATAQELLTRVEHNQTDKFKNSQFLGLMRKLRDREVRVEGDKMVDTPVSAALRASTLTPDPSVEPAPTVPQPAPESRFLRMSPPEFDTHYDPFFREHEWDHWESPFR